MHVDDPGLRCGSCGAAYHGGLVHCAPQSHTDNRFAVFLECLHIIIVVKVDGSKDFALHEVWRANLFQG
jgi:hypothetical protein